MRLGTFSSHGSGEFLADHQDTPSWREGVEETALRLPQLQVTGTDQRKVQITHIRTPGTPTHSLMSFGALISAGGHRDQRAEKNLTA